MNIKLHRRSAALAPGKDTSEGVLHGQYRQDKRALRGARVSGAGERDEGWKADADVNDFDENSRSSGSKVITLSSLPRGYWATLFNLEVVKARNRPIEPPKKPEAAPFFLATVHRAGEAEPSFPEAGTMVALAGSRKGKGEDDIEDRGKAGVGVGDSKTRLLLPQAAEDPPDGQDIQDFPQVDGAWSDDDEEENNNTSEDNCKGNEDEKQKQDGERSMIIVGGKRKLNLQGDSGERTRAQPSRILKQIKTASRIGGKGPSRCRLADLLLEYDDAQADGDRMEVEVEEVRRSAIGRFGPVMAYLKTLPPPMVDVDIISLCQGEWDDEGIRLVEIAIRFLLEELRCVLQETLRYSSRWILESKIREKGMASKALMIELRC